MSHAQPLTPRWDDNAMTHWRAAMFQHIAERLCDPNLPRIQQAVGAWPWHRNIPVPAMDAVVSLAAEGTFNFRVEVDGYWLGFGLWVTFGEIRCGAWIPETLMATGPNLRDLLFLAVDGKPCQRVVEMPDTTLFDWIYNEGFADAAIMRDALRDPVLTSAMYDRVAQILGHLYMAVMNTLLVHGGLIGKLRDGERLPGGQRDLLLVVQGPNQPDAVLERLASMVTVDGFNNQRVDVYLYLIKAPAAALEQDFGDLLGPDYHVMRKVPWWQEDAS